ncbi:uncharacterized protein LOC120179436 [Hibiscus syriacus]|uniref:uncharacterized protein LOC120179436 n=1 Tax=Hibiscus syriacus TaxID=106335 RepID=UPI001923A180|nr:uncharacterized protein LOC120179436 [Hibiscus syriacus]
MIVPLKIQWVAAQSIFYHLYNQVSYMSLDEISPLTFSVGNTMKRISVIVSSHHLPHACPARQCSWSRHCYPRNLLVFSGKSLMKIRGLRILIHRATQMTEDETSGRI